MNQSKIQLLENIKALDDSNEKLKEFLPKKNYKNLEKLELSVNVAVYNADNVMGLIPNPLLLPVVYQVKEPITIFGLTDYFSSYYTSMFKIANIIQPYNHNINGIIGLNVQPVNLLFALRGFIKIGDYARYLDAFGVGINYFRLFVNTINSSSYGTGINNLSDSIYLIQNIKVIFNNANITQLDNPLLFSKQNINGKIITDSIDLKMYVLPSSYQQTVIDIPLNIILDKNLMINQYIEFDCQNIQYIFTLLKIK